MLRALAAPLLLLLVAVEAGAAPAKAARRAAPDPIAAQVDSLFAKYDRTPSPGLAVVVVRDGKVVLRRGYGLASLEHGVRITPATVFDLASLSKQFTGLAIAMLVAEGKIALEDDVRKHLPELADFGAPITIAHLVHHTSGLRDWVSALAVAGGRRDDPIGDRQILALAFRQRTLNFPPGTRYEYSNTGYNLLAEIVRRVTGKSFRAYCDETFFRPLGMTSTRVREDWGEVIPGRASGYARGPDGAFRATPNLLVATGSSSIFGSADDFARWMLNFDSGRVGGGRAMEIMRTPGRRNDGGPVRYGFGITTGRYHDRPFFTSAGAWASFNTFEAYFPEERFGVVVLANTTASVIDAQQAVIRITDLYLPPPEAPRAAAKPASEAPAAAHEAPLDAASLAGRWRFANGGHLRLTRFGAMLLAQSSREGHRVVSPRPDGTFGVAREDDESTLAVETDGAGRVVALALDGRRAQRLAPADTVPPADLTVYAGDYDSDELGTSYRVAVENGALRLEHARRGAAALQWLWRDEFGSFDAPLASVDFERDVSGRVVAMVVNGDDRSRDLRFTRRR